MAYKWHSSQSHGRGVNEGRDVKDAKRTAGHKPEEELGARAKVFLSIKTNLVWG